MLAFVISIGNVLMTEVKFLEAAIVNFRFEVYERGNPLYIWIVLLLGG